MFPLPLHPLKTLIWFITWCLLLRLRSEQLHLASSNSDGKEPACNAGDPGLIPRSARSLEERNGNPLQYSCLENSVDRPWGSKESDITEWVNWTELMPILIKYYKCIICLEKIIQIGRKMVDCRYFTLKKMKHFLKDKNLNMPLWVPLFYTGEKHPTDSYNMT